MVVVLKEDKDIKRALDNKQVVAYTLFGEYPLPKDMPLIRVASKSDFNREQELLTGSFLSGTGKSSYKPVKGTLEDKVGPLEIKEMMEEDAMEIPPFGQDKI
ncbi:hypothetical protein KY358_04180, partial [Candidatus Woesearchaeota archaeon]|nr:hypothetical protein [Candidatus Woesearchaeota archaeon]